MDGVMISGAPETTKLAAELATLTFSRVCIERALDLCANFEREARHADHRLKGYSSHFAQRLACIQLEALDLAVRRYFINEDAEYWVYDTARFECGRNIDMYENDRLKAPYERHGDYVCCPMSYLRKNGKRV